MGNFDNCTRASSLASSPYGNIYVDHIHPNRLESSLHSHHSKFKLSGLGEELTFSFFSAHNFFENNRERQLVSSVSSIRTSCSYNLRHVRSSEIKKRTFNLKLSITGPGTPGTPSSTRCPGNLFIKMKNLKQPEAALKT